MSSADEQPWILGIRASHTAPSVCCTATRSSSRSRRNVSLESSDIAFTAGPSLATAYCLDYAGIDPSQLDLVVLCVQGRLQDEVHDLRRDPFLNVTLHDTRTLAIPHHYGHALSAFATSGLDEAASPNYAIGGLRQGLHYSEIRTDFVQHSLSALLEFQANAVARAAARIDGLAVFTV